MKDIMCKTAEKFIELIPALILALAGGFARTWAKKPRNAKYEWKIAMPELIIAGFCGIVMHYLCVYFKTPEALSAFVIAISGYGARQVLEVLNITLLQRLKSNIKEGKEK